MLTATRAAVALLAAAGLAAAADKPKGDEKLPPGVTPITKEHLVSKVPNFFYFDFGGEPQPGKRYWLRVDHKHFVERYPDGLESHFKILGRATAGGVTGTVVAKVSGDAEKTGVENDGSFQVFIPDRGGESPHLQCRMGGAGDWNDLGEMKKVE
jgi:hypothetical protein